MTSIKTDFESQHYMYDSITAYYYSMQLLKPICIKQPSCKKVCSLQEAMIKKMRNPSCTQEMAVVVG